MLLKITWVLHMQIINYSTQRLSGVLNACLSTCPRIYISHCFQTCHRFLALIHNLSGAQHGLECIHCLFMETNTGLIIIYISWIFTEITAGLRRYSLLLNWTARRSLRSENLCDKFWSHSLNGGSVWQRIFVVKDLESSGNTPPGMSMKVFP